MKTRTSPAVIGAFVIGAFALGVISLVAFGSLSLFSRPERFVVLFDESVHGLDRGSPVKLRGVRIGRVADISVRYDRARNRSVAAVLCELTPDRITDANGAVIGVTNRDSLQDLVDHGLRAQLGIAGLATGLLFVELDFLDPHQYPDFVAGTDPNYLVVPSVQSAITEFQSSVTKLLNKAQAIDFQGLSVELKRLIVAVRADVDGTDIKGLVAQWKRTGESVDQIAKSPELTKTLREMDETLAALRTALTRLDTQVDSNGQELKVVLSQTRDTLAQFNTAAVAARRFIDAQQGLGTDADRALVRLADASESIQRLADFLERNPNALIAGKKQP